MNEGNYTISNHCTLYDIDKTDSHGIPIRYADNSTQTIATRFVLIGVALSCYVYGKYAILSINGLRKHKNYDFLFSFTAAAFACANNINDLIAFVYPPESCYVFWTIFKASATLNWAPISWLQAFRLMIISKIYLPKKGYYIISIMTISLSCIYCTFYFFNLSLFDYTTNPITGCGVTNPGTYSYYVMVSDIVDSCFAFTAICTLIYRSIKDLRELNTKNQKLNDLISLGVVELLIITVSKIIIYPLIALTSYIPALDVFWDVLSVIVIICGYNLVNFPYKHASCGCGGKDKDKSRNVFTFVESSANYTSEKNEQSDTSLRDVRSCRNDSVAGNSNLNHEIL